jgi:hypothetical protein
MLWQIKTAAAPVPGKMREATAHKRKLLRLNDNGNKKKIKLSLVFCEKVGFKLP